MAVSRRNLLLAVASLPALAIVHRGTDLVAGAITGAARAARPGADGTSATRCAQCGAADHTMLDPRCPLAPKVLG
jgi:hypothetical protein